MAISAEKRRIYRRKRYAENKVLIRSKVDKEYQKEYHKKWYQDNKVRLKPIQAEYVKRNRVKIYASVAAYRSKTPENKVKFLVRAAKDRAGRFGREFSIGIGDLKPFPDKCPLLGIDLNYTGTGKATGYSASIDRVDSSKGYIKGNVRIVSRRANIIKLDATSTELRLIADNLDRLSASNKGD